jgi:uncharacterized protein YjbI with pentapeptide repeats
MFDRASFGDSARFYGASFGDSAGFYGASFGDSAMFDRASFGDSARFYGASFGDSAWFHGASFGDRASFSQARFGDRASFDSATFGDEADFNRAHFRGRTWFNRVSGFERTALEDVASQLISSDDPPAKDEPAKRAYTGHLRRPAPPDLSFVGSIFDGPTFFHHVNLSRSLFQQVDLTRVSFLYSQINQTRFIGCNWGRDRTKVLGLVPISQPRFLFDERLTRFVIKARPVYASNWRSFFALDDDEWDRIHDDMENGVLINFRRLDGRLHVRRKWSYDLKEDFQIDPARVRPIDVQAVALQLKQSLENTREPIAAGDFHFANMEMKRLQARQEGHNARARLLWIYKLINGYGERFGRTLILLGALVVLFTLIYLGLSYIGGGHLKFLPEATAQKVNPLHLFGYGHIYRAPGLLCRLWDSFVYTLQHVLPFKLQSTVYSPGSRLISFITLIQTIIGTSLFTMFILALRSRFRR